uniref:Putative neutral protease 2-like ARB_00849 n=1 Tax=Lygus hesperus TaxID=30085 RepID=A0A0A9YS02_LYGHE
MNFLLKYPVGSGRERFFFEKSEAAIENWNGRDECYAKFKSSSYSEVNEIVSSPSSELKSPSLFPCKAHLHSLPTAIQKCWQQSANQSPHEILLWSKTEVGSPYCPDIQFLYKHGSSNSCLRKKPAH